MKPILKSPWARIDPRPWPFCLGLTLSTLPISFVVWVWSGPILPLLISFSLVGFPIYFWVSDLIREGTFCGIHSSYVTSCLRTATLLFIASEVIFFFSFFWGWAHRAWAPSSYTGQKWPPAGIKPVHPFGAPVFNLARLVWSSGTVNLANGYLRVGSRTKALLYLGVTIFLSASFVGAQWVEYRRAAFTMSDRAFGRTFFLLTGFHGAHVAGGTTILAINWFRLYWNHFHTGRNIGWIAAIWYWHFVDLIWVGLWFLVYTWGGWGYYIYWAWPIVEPHYGIWCVSKASRFRRGELAFGGKGWDFFTLLPFYFDLINHGGGGMWGVFRFVFSLINS